MLKAWGAIFSDFTGKRVSAGGRGNHPLQVPLKKQSGAWTERKVQISKSGNHLIAVSDGFSP